MLAPDLPADSWPNTRPPPDRRFAMRGPRIDTARLKAERPLDAIMEARGVSLGRVNARGVREATCLCAAKRGHRPLWVNTTTQTWGCLARGSVCGGDVFAFLEQVEGLSFVDAVAAIQGASTTIDPETALRLEAERVERLALLRAEGERIDEAQRAKSYAIWRDGAPTAGTVVEAYFRHRGLAPFASRALRFAANHPYFLVPDDPGAKPRVIHRGPCLLAAIQAADGRFLGLHRTWLDPRLETGTCPPEAKGTAILAAPNGSGLPAKKMRGGKKGGAIRLVDDDGTATGRRGFLCGEGIETTVTVLQALAARAIKGVGWSAWAAGDLGNLSGGGLGPSTKHPEKPDRWVPSPDPDPDAPGLMPPAWADQAIVLGDGDSDPHVTRARLECCRARWVRAGVPTEIVMAEPGRDFNDMVRSAGVTGAAIAVPGETVPA